MDFDKRSIDYEKELKQRDETIAQLTARIQQLEAEIVELKKLLAGKGDSKTAKKPPVHGKRQLGPNSPQKETQGLERTTRE